MKTFPMVFILSFYFRIISFSLILETVSETGSGKSILIVTDLCLIEQSKMNSKVLISKLQFAILLLCVGGFFSNQSWAMERNVSQQTDRVIWDNLKNPPAGYGEVAFYWWQLVKWFAEEAGKIELQVEGKMGEYLWCGKA